MSARALVLFKCVNRRIGRGHAPKPILRHALQDEGHIYGTLHAKSICRETPKPLAHVETRDLVETLSIHMSDYEHPFVTAHTSR
jgi:hypothetical protein